MYPDLIDLGFLHLKTYGACMAVGFILCWTLIERLSKRKDLSNFILALMLSGVVGSRIAYVVEHWRSEFAARPLDVVRVDQGGLMFYGGLILAVAVFFAWCAVVFPKFSPSWYEHGRQMVPVLPTQLFEAAALLVLFAALMALYLRFRRGTCAAYLVGYGVIRFCIEFMRGDPRAAFWGLSIGQVISVCLVAAGAVLFFSTRRMRRAGDSEEGGKHDEHSKDIRH